MHPSIALFPSVQFYNNILENGVTDFNRPIVKGFNWPNKDIRICILAVSGKEIFCGDSIWNKEEVRVVMNVLVDMLKV